MDNKTYTLVPSTVEKKTNEIDIIKLFADVWYKRKFIMIFTCIFILLGLFIALTSPISYTTSCTVVPQTSSRSGGNLGGIASIMGVNLGSTMSGETLSPYVYPQIINSVPFCKEIMETPIVVERSNGEAITLYDYYTDKRYSKTNVLGIVKKYTIGLPSVIISALKSDRETISTVAYTDSITGRVLTVTKEEQRVIEVVKNNIRFESNDKDGYIKIGYSFSEAQPVAIIAQNMYSTLEKYIKSYKSQKQQDNLDFVEESYNKARNDFMEKQAALAAFQDSNRDLTSAMARTTERRLSSEYEVAYTVYNELAVQLERAKISVKESTPILTVIDPVVIPNKKSAPRRSLILVIFTLLGLALSTGKVLLQPLLKKIVVDVNNVEEIKEDDTMS